MMLRWLIPLAVLFSSLSHVMQGQVSARVATVVISPNEVTILHLRPEFESSIRMPEEATSVILGSPGTFKAEHNEGEPEYVYVKPVTKEPAQSNLLVATKSGAHVNVGVDQRWQCREHRPTRGFSARVPDFPPVS